MQKPSPITFLDSTLRDGAQGEGLSFSMQDKLNLVQTLSRFGLDYIEAGIPASNRKDMAFFKKAKKLNLGRTRLTAFGGLQHPGETPENSPSIQALLEAETPAVSLVAKSSPKQIEKILGISPTTHLKMATEAVRYLTKQGKIVIFDAEHFFDGFQEDSAFAMALLGKVLKAGAHILTLCDTNGGSTPTEITTITRKVREGFKEACLGIHAHNDCGCAIANSMLAVEAGVAHVQGTFCGFGERCGNADLSVIIPNLLLKKHRTCAIPRLDQLCATAARVAEIANVSIPDCKPYVGRSAFTHKGGMHADGMLKMPGAFEHISPDVVGNHRRYLLSEIAGRAAFVEKVRGFAPELTKDNPETTRLLEQLKNLEFSGYQFEGAEASFELMIRRELHKFAPHFQLVQYKTIGEYPAPNGKEQASAMIEIKVGSNNKISAALGDGPVHALDQALRQALMEFYPRLKKIHLVDYKVRVLDSEAATAAKVRVLIDTTDGTRLWTTVGVSTDVIEASWLALADSIEYFLNNLK